MSDKLTANDLDEESPWSDVLRVLWAEMKMEGLWWSVLTVLALGLRMALIPLNDVAKRFEAYVIAKSTNGETK